MPLIARLEAWRTPWRIQCLGEIYDIRRVLLSGKLREIIMKRDMREYTEETELYDNVRLPLFKIINGQRVVGSARSLRLMRENDVYIAPSVKSLKQTCPGPLP